MKDGENGLGASEQPTDELDETWRLAAKSFEAMGVRVTEDTLRYLKGTGWSIHVRIVDDNIAVHLAESQNVEFSPRAVRFSVGYDERTYVKIGWGALSDKGLVDFRYEFGENTYGGGDEDSNAEEFTDVRYLGLGRQTGVILIQCSEQNDIGKTKSTSVLTPSSRIVHKSRIESFPHQKLTAAD